MHHQHRPVRRDRIQLCRRRVALFGHLQRVIAHANDPALARRLRKMRLHAAHELGNIGNAPQRGISQVLAVIDHMAMGIDEARQQRAPTKINHLRRRPPEAHRLSTAAEEGNAACLNNDRLDIGRFRPCHGDDVAADENQVIAIRLCGARLRGKDGFGDQCAGGRSCGAAPKNEGAGALHECAAARLLVMINGGKEASKTHWHKLPWLEDHSVAVRT